MTIRFKCKCGRKFEVADNMAGRKARCTDCGLTFLVPKPGGSAGKPAAPPAADNPLAQIAKAAEASKKAHAAPAQPPAAARKAAPPANPRTPPVAAPQTRAQTPQQPPKRPAKPPTKQARPQAPAAAAPPPPRPVTPDGFVTPEDDVPVARLAPPAARPAAPAAQAAKPIKHLGGRKPKLTAVQTVAILSILVAVVVVVEATATMLGAMNAGKQGIQLIYGVVAIFAGVGIVTSLAGAAGSRFCIGVMLGGAGAGILGGLGLVVLGFTKDLAVVAQGENAPMVWGVAGIVALLLGVLYLLLPLISKPVRKYIFSKPAGPIVGMVLGFFLGPAIAATALPSPGMVYLRAITVAGTGDANDSDSSGDGGGGLFGGLMGKPKPNKKQLKEFEDNRSYMEDYLKAIHEGLTEYESTASELPKELELLIDRNNVPTRVFFRPSLKNPNVARDASGRFVQQPDVIYVFDKGRSRDQIRSIAEPAEIIVAHSGPECKLGDGVLVLRLPGQPKPVEWLTREQFKKQMEVTRKWLQENPPPDDSFRPPDRLPGID